MKALLEEHWHHLTDAEVADFLETAWDRGLDTVRPMCGGCALPGGGGVLLVTAGGYEHLRTPVVPIKSKVGAGDSMVAGVVLSLARGNEVRDAVRFGVAAGAAAVMTPGSELCRREDAERLYGELRAEHPEQG